jgi:predicted Rossmann fold nucleotide-binding protein DprA/Smf involved in DNA uptake
MFIKDRVINQLKPGPKTIPELAAEMGCSSPDMVRWVMALRRYGKVTDMPKARADDYYQYKAVPSSIPPP